MTNVGIVFDIMDDEASAAPAGWPKVTMHLIFDVKMHLERKGQWVLDGHLLLMWNIHL